MIIGIVVSFIFILMYKQFERMYIMRYQVREREGTGVPDTVQCNAI